MPPATREPISACHAKEPCPPTNQCSICPDTASGSPCAFPVPLELGDPQKAETPASIVWFPLGFEDTFKFGSSNGWDLWQGFHLEPLWNLCLMCLPLDFGVPSTPCGFWGPLRLPHHSRTPLFLHQEAQNSAGPLLVYFASRLFSWGSEPLRGGSESRQGVEFRGRCRSHKQRHCTHHHRRHNERGPHMPSTAQEEVTSVTDTDITAKVGK